MSAHAIVFDIQRACIHDGPGLRTVVFFKGCALDCRWCQNPEGRDPKPELAYYEERCLPGCTTCLSSCPHDALHDRVAGRVDWSACVHCGACVEVCPTNALVSVGRTWTAEALLAEVAADRSFFAASGGGVTLSGGEPALHAEFLREFLPAAKQAGLDLAIETAGNVPWSHYEAILPWIDRVLYDVKVGDHARHLALTGHDDVRVLDNLRRLIERREAGAKFELEVRMPVVPGLNTDDAALAGLARSLRELEVATLGLLPYNHLWEAKLPRLSGDRPALGIRPQPPEYYAELIARFAAQGITATMA
ncbi:glycyl-radical enzyme activating protein [Nannocystaceae bacterium ST9]